MAKLENVPFVQDVYLIGFRGVLRAGGPSWSPRIVYLFIDDDELVGFAVRLVSPATAHVVKVRHRVEILSDVNAWRGRHLREIVALTQLAFLFKLFAFGENPVKIFVLLALGQVADR